MKKLQLSNVWIIVAASIATIIGVYIIAQGNAATLTQSFEAENGQLGGNKATITESSSASNSAYSTLNAVSSSGGNFSVNNGAIIDPEGNPFLPRGINVVGARSFAFWDDAFNAHGKADFFKNTWNFNIIRLVYCETCISHGPGSQTYGDLDTLIQEYTSRKMVVLVDVHEDVPCGTKTQQTRDFTISFLRGIATKYKDNPYVWMQPYNEPMVDDQVDAWYQLQTPVLTEIRSTGNTNMVVLNEPSCGQARDAANVNSRFDITDSGAIMKGQELVAAFGNVMFDMHAYSRWGFGTTDDDLRNYFREIHSRGLALLIGETGAYNNSGFEAVFGDKDGTNRLYRVNHPGIGILGWMGPFTTAAGGSPDDMSVLHWQWSHNPPSPYPEP